MLSEAELKMLLSRSTEEGEIEHEEREMLYNVFDFADKEVSDVMVPRPEVVALAIDMPPEECLKAAVESPYTRYPSTAGRWTTSSASSTSVTCSAPRSSPAGSRTWRSSRSCGLRTSSRRRRTWLHCSASSGGRRSTWRSSSTSTAAMEGIVTLEDLLEEIVGEIEDEFDLPDESVEQVDDKRIRIHGTFTIDDFNEEFHVDLPAGGLQHRRRLRLRRARSRAARGRHGRARRPAFHGDRDRGQPDRAARGRVPAGGASSRRAATEEGPEADQAA